MSDADGAAGRILGWDVLRGLCALAVASYHLLYWSGLADLITWGSYGVYLFFVLSGASLALTYAGAVQEGRFAFGRFLWVRWMRLAPLYLLLLCVVMPWKILHEGLSVSLMTRLALNISFLFGFADPSQSALLVGGWSLGVEAIFYLLLPALLWLARGRTSALVLFAVVAAVQWGWVLSVFDRPGGYAANMSLYHQVPPFLAYFCGGCLIGLAVRAGHRVQAPNGSLLALLVCGFGTLLQLVPARQGDELVGWRGAVLFALCFVMVWVAGGLRLREASARWATHLGDATYGLYLMHPVLYFGLTFTVLPRMGVAPVDQWSTPARLGLVGGVLATAFVLALASERWFERPLREWSKSLAR